MKGRSWVTILLSFYNKVVLEAVDRDENYYVIHLDFGKVFDRVPHHLLLLKLQAHREGGKVQN